MGRVERARITFWLIRLCRLGMVVSTGFFGVILGMIAFAAAEGDYPTLSDMVDATISGPVLAWQIVLMLVLVLIALSPLFYAFWTVHCFFREYETGNHFGIATERALRRLGWSIASYWLLGTVVVPAAVLILTFNDPKGWQYPIDIALDDAMILPVFGLLLICVARLLSEARRIDEDNRLII